MSQKLMELGKSFVYIDTIKDQNRPLSMCAIRNYIFHFLTNVFVHNRSLEKSIQSDDSTVTADDNPLVGTMDLDHVSQQLKTLVSVVN